MATRVMAPGLGAAAGDTGEGDATADRVEPAVTLLSAVVVRVDLGCLRRWCLSSGE